MYFSTVRITVLTVKHLFNFSISGYRARTALNVWNGCPSEQYKVFFVPSLVRKIRTYPSLLRENFNTREDQTPNKNQGNKKKFKGIKVSIVNENNVGTYMYLEDAEKYAKRNNLSLVELSDSTKEKPKYKLQRVAGVFETQSVNKIQSRKVKQILLREGISKNDLLIKVNQMLKFLQKEFKVLCVIDSKDNQKLENIINEINTNGLQAYCCQKMQTARGMKLIFEPKSTEPKKALDV